MLQTLRVLQAAVALHEFTVRDVADYSAVPASTVRTVLERSSELFPVIETKLTNKRGGQWKVYQATPGAAKKVSDLLAANRAAVVQFPEPPGMPPPPPPQARLASIENFLLRPIEPRASALELAERSIAELQSETKGSNDIGLWARLHNADTLARTISADIAGSQPEPGQIERDWNEALRLLTASGNMDMAERTIERVRNTQLGQSIELPDPTDLTAVGDVLVVEATQHVERVSQMVHNVLNQMRIHTQTINWMDPNSLDLSMPPMQPITVGVQRWSPPVTACIVTTDPTVPNASKLVERCVEEFRRFTSMPIVMVTAVHDIGLQKTAINNGCTYMPIDGLDNVDLNNALRHSFAPIPIATPELRGLTEPMGWLSRDFFPRSVPR